MIDLHSHILPGLDDGSRTVEDARELARRAAEDGVTAIAATPHVRSDYPTRPEEMERGVSRLREDFLEQGIDVEVLPGGEIDLGMLASLDDDGLRRFTLARRGATSCSSSRTRAGPPGWRRPSTRSGSAGSSPSSPTPSATARCSRTPGGSPRRSAWGRSSS